MAQLPILSAPYGTQPDRQRVRRCARVHAGRQGGACECCPPSLHSLGEHDPSLSQASGCSGVSLTTPRGLPRTNGYTSHSPHAQRRPSASTASVNRLPVTTVTTDTGTTNFTGTGLMRVVRSPVPSCPLLWGTVCAGGGHEEGRARGGRGEAGRKGTHVPSPAVQAGFAGRRLRHPAP